MNMPRFTAEAALYKANGHYQTGRQAINLSAEMIRTIHPAMEKIEVHGCAPGSYLVENDDGTWDCWVNPDPWGGSGGGSGMPGPGGGGQEPEQPPGRPEPMDDKPKPKPKKDQMPPRPRANMACNAIMTAGAITDGRYRESKDTGSDWQCCDTNMCIGCGKKGKWHINKYKSGNWNYVCRDGSMMDM